MNTENRKEERNALVLAHLDLPRRVVNACFRFPEGREQEGWGYVGLIQAAERWRPGEVPFAAFAWPWVRGRILRALRRDRYDGPAWWQITPLGGLVWDIECPPIDEGRFWEAVAGLTLAQQDAVYCRVVLGMTAAELAGRWGCTRRNAVVAYERALKNLRKQVGGGL